MHYILQEFTSNWTFSVINFFPELIFRSHTQPESASVIEDDNGSENAFEISDIKTFLMSSSLSCWAKHFLGFRLQAILFPLNLNKMHETCEVAMFNPGTETKPWTDIRFLDDYDNWWWLLNWPSLNFDKVVKYEQG